MLDLHKLLFEAGSEGQSIFKNQQDLVLSFLNDPDTKYYMDITPANLYQKAQTRLKTYISQLLSETAIRNVTEDFKSALSTVLHKRLNNAERAESILNIVINELIRKNSFVQKNEGIKSSTIDEFSSSFSEASYIVIITAKPLEIDGGSNTGSFSLKSLFARDFFDCLTSKGKDLKKYRFNFPLSSSADLFWLGMKKIIYNFLLTQINNEVLLDSLYNKFAIKTETLAKLTSSDDKKDGAFINSITNEILELLNRNGYLLVFTSDAPIYLMPTIALNPAESRTFKLYSILDTETSTNSILYKFTSSDSTLWRLFVWDKLKAPKYRGTNIPFNASEPIDWE